MQYLMNEGLIIGVATPDMDAETVALTGVMAQTKAIPHEIIPKSGHKAKLISWLNAMQPDAVFVITCPWKITGEMRSIPKYGFLNFHFGLLPEMRGADPIFEAIRQRMSAAGCTVHVMDDGFDSGPIVAREAFAINPELTYGMLSAQMAMLGERLCRDVVAQLVAGTLNAEPQVESNAKYWPKVNEDAVTIRWNKMDKDAIIALVRAGNPISKGAPTSINGWKFAVCDISEVNLQGDASAIVPGTIIAIDHQNGLIIGCIGGKAVKLEVVYTSEGYFPGYKLLMFGIQPGMILSS